MPASPLAILPALSSAFSPASVISAAQRARRRYVDLIAHADAGVCVPTGTWRALHEELFSASCALVELHNSDARPPLLTPDVVQVVVDCDRDVEHRIASAERMLEVAKRGRVIDMATLAEVAS
jgi:hypothetical protein